MDRKKVAELLREIKISGRMAHMYLADKAWEYIKEKILNEPYSTKEILRICSKDTILNTLTRACQSALELKNEGKIK